MNNFVIKIMSPIELLKARKEISRNFKKSRIKKGISIAAIARESGLSENAIRSIEKGNNTWRINSEILYTDACNTVKPLRKLRTSVKNPTI